MKHREVNKLDKEHMLLSVIILAAGQSKRMGQIKQLMPFGQSTVLGEVINNFLLSAASEIILVLGYKAEEVMKTIASKPTKIVINPYYRRGMSTSIIAGMNHVDVQTQAVMLALGDQPLIGSFTINKLIKEFYRYDKGIVIPIYCGRRGHPIIFAIKYKEELLKLKGDVGGRQIIKSHPDDLLEVPVASENVLIDFDTNNDYQTYTS